MSVTSIGDVRHRKALMVCIVACCLVDLP